MELKGKIRKNKKKIVKRISGEKMEETKKETKG
jgi:hypothetical protein